VDIAQILQATGRAIPAVKWCQEFQDEINESFGMNFF
jgi:hypothetical protein